MDIDRNYTDSNLLLHCRITVLDEPPCPSQQVKTWKHKGWDSWMDTKLITYSELTLPLLQDCYCHSIQEQI